MSQIRNTYMLVITVAFAILLLYTCSQKPCEGDGIVVSSKIKIDSSRTHHEHYKDSVDKWIKYDFTEVPFIEEETKEEYHQPFFSEVLNNEETLGIDLSDTNEFKKGLRVFHYGKQDSALKYTIRVHGTERPDKVEMEYLLLQRTFRDSVYVRDSIHVKQTDKVRINQLYYGVEAIVYPNLQAMFIGVDFVSKKGWQAEIGVGADITNLSQPQLMGKVGLKKLFTLRKKK